MNAASPTLLLASAIGAVLFTLPAAAQAMPNSLNMSCAQAQALVAREGAVVIGTGPNLFDRYVTDAGYCSTQRSKPAWIATRDNPQCLVGQECRERRFRWR
ncbi:hypothetical protein [Ancylobacter sp. IITR112]|uniref:hypothetical protein n=1 Tax=Ancylobacter sp. IITR112 TaxID=3138073 RepID=UPI00352AA23A